MKPARLTVASADHGLHLLTKTPLLEESAFRFGGCLTGHHGKVNDMAFCGGQGTDNMRYIGTVSGTLSPTDFIYSLNPLQRRQDVDDMGLVSGLPCTGRCSRRENGSAPAHGLRDTVLSSAYFH